MPVEALAILSPDYLCMHTYIRKIRKIINGQFLEETDNDIFVLLSFNSLKI